MTTEDVIKALNDNKAYKIYKCAEFTRLKKRILEKNHFECALCKENNKITRANTVHHIQEVKKHPELAFEEFYIDRDGIKQKNLIPLCFDCHNAIHERYGYRPNQTKEKSETFVNEERW